MTTVTGLRWTRIIIGAVAPHAIAIAALVVAIVGYSLVLAVGVGGVPGPGSTHEFTTVSGTQLFPLLTILLTGVAARWVVRRGDPGAATIHGFVVGVPAGLLGFTFGAFDGTMLIRFGTTIAAGVLGAKLQPVLRGE